ncbi:MAG: phosphoglucosamine mutase [Candidatus Paceibacterota bacterium]
MENKPKLTVSGYRGIWGETLNEEIAFSFGISFAKIIKKNNGKKIIIGRDSRKSGPKIFEILKLAFKKEGISVIDAGVIPTPSILLLVKKLKLDGGIIITASHNPKEYNGLKFVTKDGLFAGKNIIEQINEVKEHLKEKYIPNKKIHYTKTDNKKFRQIHISEILKNINIKDIRGARYKVTVDTINGASGVIIRELLKKLNCKVKIINAKQDGEFAHPPEPLVKNLKQISIDVIKNKSDIGFVTDPDGDRLLVVNEKGEIISEEYTMALAIKNILKKEKTDVVVNMSTSNMCKDVTESFGKKLIRSKVGELNVVEKMFEIGSTLSGEGNGGIIYPKINTARDALVGIGVILELMTEQNQKISQIVEEIPKYILLKEKISYNGDLKLLNNKLKKVFSDNLSINEIDGIRFDFKDSSWLHVRPSNTEPIVRIYIEAKTNKRIKEIFKKTKDAI